MKHNLGLTQTACHRFPRFVITDDHLCYWDGSGWTREPREALLFVSLDAISEEVKKIKAKQRSRQ